jgi:hypothetical protein
MNAIGIMQEVHDVNNNIKHYIRTSSPMVDISSVPMCNTSNSMDV